MVTLCVAGNGDGRVVVLEGLQSSTLVAEIFGVHQGFVRHDARLLRAEVRLVEAGVTTDDVFHVCAAKGGGMPSWLTAADPDLQGIFATVTSGTEEAGPGSEQGLAEGLGQLLHHLSEDVSEIEGAVLNLNHLLRSGQHSSRRFVLQHSFM
jgi:hypothetical protein